MSDQQPPTPNRQVPFSDAFKEFIRKGWAAHPTEAPDQLPAARYAAGRRQAVSAQFPGDRLVISAGGLKVRSNDTDYRFRPHSAFTHLTGLGTDQEPDAVLVLDPTDDGHDATVYFKPRAPRDSAEFYSDTRYGEMWVGRRPSVEELSSRCGVRCAPIDQLAEDLSKNADSTQLRAVRTPADTSFERLLTAVRKPVTVEEADEQDRADASSQLDQELAVALSELRLIKDEFEISQLRQACEQTAHAFGAVVAALPEATRRDRGERWVEGVFGLHARHAGNAVGYDTIAAAGDHACTLHWIRNDGDLRDGELLLMDAGVELDTLYTADVTRTLPINGRFSDDQRMVYEAVLEAQEAGMAAARPGARFSDVHKAAVAVIARHLHDWGLLPISVEQSLSTEGGLHRRWMVHGTSHHLGLDVHDCAQARVENYREGTLRPGMVFTVEPGLYFKPDDELVPHHLRGIGVRIEDDILITETGCENLSVALPRSSADVEAWMASIWTG
ncbi:MAG TPA: aminopeptidase P family protein [Propionibacteriaceae bacterium]|nr:aminopeptidase P family protein [Propionibacteriaceae bacterium]